MLDIDRMRACSPLLPPPGAQVVNECLDEVSALRARVEELETVIKAKDEYCERVRKNADRRWEEAHAQTLQNEDHIDAIRKAYRKRLAWHIVANRANRRGRKVAEQKVAEMEMLLSSIPNSNQQERAEKAEARLERLKPYARHLDYCECELDMPRSGLGNCTCGYEEALK